VIYNAGEVGGTATNLSSLSLYFASATDKTLNSLTIRLKNTTLSAYPNPGLWENTGWTTVYSANRTISQTGWVTFNFTTPFSYTGGNLMVDFSFNGYTPFPGSPYPLIRMFSTSTLRTISSFGSSAQDPLTWSGSTPFPTRFQTVPQIKLGYGGASSPVSPTTVLLTNGTWTGSLYMGAGTTSTSLIATDSSGATGRSNSFGVTTSPDSDGDGLPNFWETANGLASDNTASHAGAMGDLDGDGIPNLLEYALNLDPRAPGTSGLPFSVKTVNPVDGEEYLELTYRRRIGAAGIRYIIETSTDCVTWSPAASQYEAAAGPLATGDGISKPSPSASCRKSTPPRRNSPASAWRLREGD